MQEVQAGDVGKYGIANRIFVGAPVRVRVQRFRRRVARPSVTGAETVQRWVSREDIDSLAQWRASQIASKARALATEAGEDAMRILKQHEGEET